MVIPPDIILLLKVLFRTYSPDITTTKWITISWKTIIIIRLWPWWIFFPEERKPGRNPILKTLLWIENKNWFSCTILNWKNVNSICQDPFKPVRWDGKGRRLTSVQRDRTWSFCPEVFLWIWWKLNQQLNSLIRRTSAEW